VRGAGRGARNSLQDQEKKRATRIHIGAGILYRKPQKFYSRARAFLKQFGRNDRTEQDSKGRHSAPMG